MVSILHSLPRTALEELARALKSGRIQPPYSPLAFSDCLADGDQVATCAELERLRLSGMAASQIGLVIDLLATERARQQKDDDRIEMVWTGPDQEGLAARDTGVVARDLLSRAKNSLLITTFALSRDESTFAPVNAVMAQHPGLEVTLVLHVDMSRTGQYRERAATAFAKDFWICRWPWATRPKVFYDPRGTSENPMERALQHSKCIVADREWLFVTSANYTESGQLRNIELGVLVREPRLAVRVEGQFMNLISKGLLRGLPT